MNRPWLKFHPRDWMHDPKLRAVSYAARGLWIDLISVMHDCDPYGHLTLDGKTPTVAQAASMLGTVEAVIGPLLDELEAVGVYSRTDGGAIFSRRMVRDEALALARGDAGRSGMQSRYAEPVTNGYQTSNKPSNKPTTSPRARTRVRAGARAASVSVSESVSASDSPSRVVSEHWCAAFLAKRGAPYVFKGGRDGAAIKAALEAAKGDPAEVCLRIDRAFESQWWLPKLTLPKFASNWNDFAPTPIKAKKARAPHLVDCDCGDCLSALPLGDRWERMSPGMRTGMERSEPEQADSLKAASNARKLRPAQ